MRDKPNILSPREVVANPKENMSSIVQRTIEELYGGTLADEV